MTKELFQAQVEKFSRIEDVTPEELQAIIDDFIDFLQEIIKNEKIDDFLQHIQDKVDADKFGLFRAIVAAVQGTFLKKKV